MEKTIKYLENGEYHYATVRSVGDLAELKTDSKETLVEAINELWNGGGNADPSKAPKPEGYDQLVQDVADAVKNQQEINQQWTEWQKEDAQLTEERKQAYLQAMKEMQESIDKAKADAAALDKKLQEGVDTLNNKTSKLDEEITKTFSDLDTSIQNMHEQLQKEADRMNQELIDTKSDLTKVRTDLQNAQLDNGRIHDELTNINGKFEHKVWQTDLDPLKEQIDRAETSVQQTKDELLGKASRQDLDTVTNTVSKLDTQLKETAKGVEISVKKDELGGEIAEALTNKTNILLGTRRFTTNNWQQREHVEMCSDPWKGFLVAKQNSPIEGIQQAYDVKAGTTYTFSLFAKMDTLDDSNKPQIILAKNNLDTSLDTKIDVWRKEIEDITSDFKRYDLTFTPSEDCTIYPHVISNSNNPIFVCGYQLEIGKTSTPWEPNQEDVGDYVEKSEAQFNVYNDKIQALTEKQRQQGDTQEKLRTEVTQTAEGTRQVSENLKKTNDDITKLRGEFELKADHMKSEYETYTNKAVGQISDSTLNLIRNSSFQNKDEDFAQWQNVSAKANVRQDGNGLRWVELTQSGMTTDNPQGLTSNYFNVKQGKVTIAVDIKSGDKATLDNESVLFLELYNDAKKRVDFRFVTLSELGLSKNLLDDHKVHRGLYRLGIDRNDAKYMTVKAHLMRNGDLYFTNFSARLSSIDDGAYEPNPDDLNQQILKQNTKIEQNAKEVAIKANSVDVTRDIKSAVDGIKVGGTNLAAGTNQEYTMGYGIPNTTWKDGFAYATLPTTGSGNEILPQDPHMFWYALTAGQEYTQTIWFKTDATVKDLKASGITWFTGDGHDYQPATIQRIGPNSYKMFSSYKWPGKNNNDVRLFDISELRQAFDLNTGTYLKFGKLKLEEGNKSTSWSPAPEDTSAEIKSAKDAAIQVASDQINIHVNELSTSFDDKLNTRVNEAKTASEKFTSDGIEQTVTKITNVKNDVDRLGDKVDGIQVGGRNYLRNSDKSISGWAQDLGTLPNEALNQLAGKTITVSVDVEWNNFTSDSSTQNRLGFEAAVTGSDGKGYWLGAWKWPSTPSGKERISAQWSLPAGVTFTANNNSANGYVSISGTGKVSHAKIEVGNKQTDWTPAPEDTSEEIKSAKEAAIKVSSDKIDLQVQEITGKFNDKLNKSAVEIKSASEKFTTDGIEQTVTKITNVKNDVDRLGDKVDGIRVGGRNLLHGTSNKGRQFTQSGWGTVSTANSTDFDVGSYHGGNWFTYSATISNTGKHNVALQAITLDRNKKPISYFDSSVASPGSSNVRLKVSLQIDTNTYYVRTWVFFPGNDGSNDSFWITEEQLEEGNMRTPWSPNPDDVNQQITNTNKKIDTQTLDSANINDLKTQGHYFIKSLTGNPIGGWVYVDVTGNNNDRIRQDVYQDNGTKHMYRRLFGSSWSDWEQGAYLSDVNSLKTEVTASVKNLGDRVTTEVNSITTRQNNFENDSKMQHSNDTELVRKSDFEDGSKGNWTVTGVVSATNPAPPAELGQAGMKVLQTNSRDGYENGIWYSVKPGEKFDVDYWCAPSTAFHTTFGLNFVDKNKGNNNWQGVSSDQSGQWKHYTGTITAPANASFARPWFQMEKPADNTINSSWIAKPHIRRQNPATIEAIREVNTKWDVANGQIQGKVTATDVNNILNGKGYATQSWAQTMFQMKSDSITLQAVRDNITNGIQNQVNSTRDQVKGLQNQFNTQTGINLLKGTADFSGPWFNKNDKGWSYSGEWQPPTSENKSERNNNVVYQDSGHAWDGLGQTVELDTGEYTFSMWMWPTLSGNESMNIYAGDSQYGGTAKVNYSGYRYSASQPQNRWILVKTYLTVTQGGKLSIRPELNQASGTIHVASYMLQHGHVENPVWAPAPDDLAPKSIISSINITPDQIKIASNKIVIDGNTDIHGDLRTDRVRLVGKHGAIDMTGDVGIKLTNDDGSSMLLGRSNIDLMYKNDFRMNIDSSLMTIYQRNQFTTQKNPIAILNIGSSWNHSNNKVRGADIRYNPGNVNDEQLHGADYLSLSYNKPNLSATEANIHPQITLAYQDLNFDSTHRMWKKGVNINDDLTLGNFQRINVGVNDKNNEDGKWTNDPLMISRGQWNKSSQADRYQPTIRLGYDKDNMGSAGVTFLWNQVKPFGNRDISDLGDIWFNGQRFVFGWASHKSMFDNQQQPAFMRLDDKGGIMSGIAFTPGSTWDLGSGAWNISLAMMALKDRGII